MTTVRPEAAASASDSASARMPRVTIRKPVPQVMFSVAMTAIVQPGPMMPLSTPATTSEMLMASVTRAKAAANTRPRSSSGVSRLSP